VEGQEYLPSVGNLTGVCLHGLYRSIYQKTIILLLVSKRRNAGVGIRALLHFDPTCLQCFLIVIWVIVWSISVLLGI
jgi:hypothetical protein